MTGLCTHPCKKRKGGAASIQGGPAPLATDPLTQTATTKNQFSGFCYDLAGNLLGQSGCPGLPYTPTYSYDAENRMTTTAGVTYSYDGDGKRVKKSSGTLYWTGMGSDALDETDLAGTVQREYVYFNGKRVARLTPPSTVRYFYSDHLGSHGLVTSATGAIQEESDYHPYGEEAVIVDTLSTQPYKFTGKERDAESGLDYFIVRHYSSALGRFMQPDEFKGGPVDAFDGETGPPGPLPYANIFNPQSLNKYSYTYNNPLRYTDPNGHCAEDACLVEGAVAIGAGVIFTAATIQYYRQNPDAGAALAAGASAAHQAFTNAMGAISGLFFSKDAEAGQLQAAGRDATDRANATIERASQDIAGFKNPADVKSHIDELQKGVDRVRDLSGQLDKTKGKTERDKIKSDLQKAIDQVKGHEKDLRNKPPKKPEKQESQ